MENFTEYSSRVIQIPNKGNTPSAPFPDIKASVEKISQVFKIKYEESFHDILCEDQKQFLNSITLKSIQILKELLPNELFSNPSIKEAIKTQESLYYKEYTSNYKLLSSAWNDYDINLKALMKYSKQLSIKNNDNFSFLKQFRKHCANSDVLASHFCSKTSKFLEVTDKNENISHVICTECKRVYLSSLIELYCYQCKTSYASSILPPNENPDIQPANWDQYHCGVFFNHTMKCIKCKSTLYLNVKTALLMCLNKKCNFVANPSSIVWNCVFCKKDFRSEARMYNSTNVELIKKAIKIALVLQKKGHPYELNCCKEGQSKTHSELESIDFTHKADCNGILYKGTLNNRGIIVCNKCHGMNYSEKFFWTCPFCHKRNKTKSIQNQQETREVKEANDDKSTKEVKEANDDDKSTKEDYDQPKLPKNNYRGSVDIFNPEKKKFDISSIVSPNKKDVKPRRYSTLLEMLEKREKNHLKVINGTSRNIHHDNKGLNVDYVPLSTDPSPISKNNHINKIHIKKYTQNAEDADDYDDKASEKEEEEEDDVDDDNNNEFNKYHHLQTEYNTELKEIESNESILEKMKRESNIPSFSLDNYEIVKPVGEGSFGKIYLIKNKTTKQVFSLKKVIAHSIPEIIQFKKEFELVYSVQHQNIMKIFNIDYKSLDFSTYSIYVIMELAKKDWNSEIQSRISSQQRYKEYEIFNILKQLVSSLSFLQRKSISHRDIKPQNVLIYDNSVYKVADFGEAKEVKISKGVSTLKGTELYMSPVLYDGLKRNLPNVVHDPYKSDVFSLGYCVLYASTLSFSLLTDIREIKDMKKLSSIVSTYFAGKYSNQLLSIILKMLEVDEGKRYDFINLEKALENRSLSVN